MKEKSVIKKISIMLPVVYILILFAVLSPVYEFLGVLKTALVFLLILALEYKYKFIRNSISEKIIPSILCSGIFIFYFIFLKKIYLNFDIWADGSNSTVKVVIIAAGIWALLYPIVNIILIKFFDIKEVNIKKLIASMAVAGTLFFMLSIYLPSETYINNFYDYEFAYQSFIFQKIKEFMLYSIVLSIVMAFLKENIFRIVTAVFFAIDISVYLQYMFFNKNLIMLNGETMNWDDYKVSSVVSLLLWALSLALSVLFSMKFHHFFDKIKVKVPVIIGLIQFLSLAVMIIIGGRNLFTIKVDSMFMSGDEQYTVSSEDNIILFILDATDNSYFDELYNERPEVFDGFEDFTLYNNTCSVFDSTPTSISQMLTGSEFNVDLPGEEWYNQAWNGDKSIEFFKRFHDANYIVNGYSIECDSNERLEGKIDNYKSFDADKDYNNVKLDRKGLSYDFTKLALYRALPFMFKRFVGMEHVDFNGRLDIVGKSDYYNNDFDKNLNLKLSENGKNYFIIQHLYGTHPPVNDAIEETVYLLKILRKYISQLKALGVYDNSSIIITADHGKHNNSTPQEAATPVFMIKNKGSNNLEMKISCAPIYHEDIQSTLLDCAGLFDKNEDEKFFGKSIFDINEHEKRIRTWYDRRCDPEYEQVPKMSSFGLTWDYCNAYYGYTYTGDTQVLNDMVANGNVTNKYHMTDNKG